MKDLSIGVALAWQIAANETAIAKYQYIEKEQILIGILSIEKILIMSNLGLQLTRKDRLDLIDEFETIEKILEKSTSV